MNLRFARHGFIWHIIGKDLRRLWWMIALTLALLARLAHFDSLRAFATPGSDEGWLNILLPLAWSLLIALALLEDPVVADTPFWATVPCKWQSVLAAKALFVAMVIHVPYLVACAYILHARGFAPSDFLAALLYRQLAVLALTSASLALATVVRNVTQFMVVAIALATAVAAPSMGWNTDEQAVHHIREILAFPIITVVACLIAVAQYARRRNAVSRIGGAVAVLIVAVIWWLPREDFYGIRATLYPAPATAGDLSVHLADGLEPPEAIRGKTLPIPFGKASVAIPIVASGLRDNTRIRFVEHGPEFVDADGTRYRAQVTGLAPNALPCCRNLIPWWQILAIDPAVYERIKDRTVKMEGSWFVEYYRPAVAVSDSLGKTAVVPEAGRCSADLPIRDNPANEALRVECEWPNALPAVKVKLTDSAGGREWNQYLGSSRTLMSYPTGTWLSPIYRSETGFQLTDEEHYHPLGGQWSVPREVVQAVGISITPEIPEGARLVHYELPNIKLSEFVVKP